MGGKTLHICFHRQYEDRNCENSPSGATHAVAAVQKVEFPPPLEEEGRGRGFNCQRNAALLAVGLSRSTSLLRWMLLSPPPLPPLQEKVIAISFFPPP